MFKVCFFSRWLTVKPVFLGDRKGNTTFHKHHIILSPYLRAEEILYTNEDRCSAWERIRSNSNLNWHFKMEAAGLWLRMEAAECICFWFYESRSTFPAAFPPRFQTRDSRPAVATVTQMCLFPSRRWGSWLDLVSVCKTDYGGMRRTNKAITRLPASICCF